MSDYRQDLKDGKIIVETNGHCSGLNDFEYKHLLSNGSAIESGECYLCGEKTSHRFTDRFNYKHPRKIEIVTWDYGNRLHKDINTNMCAMADHEKQEGAYLIDIPTGHFVIGNYFIDNNSEASFSVPREERYSPKYNICNLNGRNNTADYLSKNFNIGYVQINSSVSVWVSNDTNKILLVMEPCDDGTRKKKGIKKFNNQFLKDHIKIGDLDQQVWRYEFADQQILDKYKAIPSKSYESLELNITRGKYSVKHHYGKMYFEGLDNTKYVVVTEIELVASTRTIITEKHKND